jgi:hypothetical protein
MKRGFIICFVFLCGLFSFNKGYCQDSLPFSYGLNTNFYFLSRYSLYPVSGANYSLYAQYKWIGIIGGYSRVSNEYQYNPGPLIKGNGFNGGLIIKLPENK